MTRSRRTAKESGTKFETLITRCLRDELKNDNIERLRTAGANDRGDIGNVRLPNGDRVCVECKDSGGRYEVGPWLKEVEAEKINYDAPVGVVVAKRRGVTDPLQQTVFMTVADLIHIITGGE